MEKVDFTKQYKDLYLPKKEPVLINIPSMSFIMVDGKGNPNEEGGEYSEAVGLLYALSFTIKMSMRNGFVPKGYYDYVIPPLEGLWWMDEWIKSKERIASDQSSDTFMDYNHKEKFFWTSMIRQPEFVTKDLFDWAKTQVEKKKPELDVSKARLKEFSEGLCVQMMHHGTFDTEPESIKLIDHYIEKNGLRIDIGAPLEDGLNRRHHEIYLGDPRKTAPERRRTVLRHPVRKLEI